MKAQHFKIFQGTPAPGILIPCSGGGGYRHIIYLRAEKLCLQVIKQTKDHAYVWKDDLPKKMREIKERGYGNCPQLIDEVVVPDQIITSAKQTLVVQRAFSDELHRFWLQAGIPTDWDPREV